MQLYLVRHGETPTNVQFVPGVLRPTTEPLTDLGVIQAQKATDWIATQPAVPTLIVSSPYTRAVQTAEVIRRALAVPLEENDALGEYVAGDWDGKTLEEYTLLFSSVPAADRYTFQPPHGESWLEVARRLQTVVEDIKNRKHDSAVLVTHYDPIKALVNLLVDTPPVDWDQPLKCPPGSVTVLADINQQWNIQTTYGE